MEKYNEILRLKKMLEDAKIPFVFDTYGDGYYISILKNHNVLYIVDENQDVNGAEYDKLQLFNGLTWQEVKECDNFCYLNFLSAEEVFKRLKYCYEHDTKFYTNESEPPMFAIDEPVIYFNEDDVCFVLGFIRKKCEGDYYEVEFNKVSDVGTIHESHLLKIENREMFDIKRKE